MAYTLTFAPTGNLKIFSSPELQSFRLWQRTWKLMKENWDLSCVSLHVKWGFLSSIILETELIWYWVKRKRETSIIWPFDGGMKWDLGRQQGVNYFVTRWWTDYSSPPDDRWASCSCKTAMSLLGIVHSHVHTKPHNAHATIPSAP